MPLASIRNYWPEPNVRRRITALGWGRWLVGLAGVAGVGWSMAVGPRWVSVPVIAAAVFMYLALRAWEDSLRRQFVREASLPTFLAGKLCASHPQLSELDAELVLRGLRQFFLAHLRSGRRFVAMPSRVVDDAWHQYILHTRAYQRWCEGAFGRMLHHTPAEVLGRDAWRNDGLRRTWFWACQEENIDPRQPSRLPLLFALDAKLGIAGGFVYEADCGSIERAAMSGAHCGAHFSDEAGGPGDAEGLGGCDSPSSGSDGSGSDGDGSDGD